MTIAKTILAAAVAATAFSAPLLAQDAEFQLPSSARQLQQQAVWITRPWVMVACRMISRGAWIPA